MIATETRWTAEQEADMRRALRLFDEADLETSSPEGQQIIKRLRKELGPDVSDALEDYVSESPEPAKPEKSDAPVGEPTDAPVGEDYDLLAFEVYDPKLERTVAAVGYMIDQHCRPHGTGGRRRKRGPLTHQHCFVKRKGKKPHFFSGYWLTIGGRQRKVTAMNLAMARYQAERKRRQEEPEL